MSGAPEGEQRLADPDADAAGSGREGERRPRLFGLHTALSALVTLVALALMARLVDLRAVGQELARCKPGLVVAGMLAHYATYPIRGARWRRSLRHLHPKAGVWRFGLVVFFYNFVDNVVPAKLGDVYGAHLARINLGVPRTAALGGIVFLRIVDAWVVLVLAAPAAWMVFSEALPDGIRHALGFGVALALVGTGAAVALLVLERLPAGRLPEPVARRIAQFRVGMWPRRRELPTIALLTVAIWALETAWIWLLVRAFGLSPSWTELLFLTMLPILASAFPLTPSGAGVVEFTLFGCLRAVGTGAAAAASITVLNRFIDFWLHIALGVVAWFGRRRIGLRTWKEVELPAGNAIDSSLPGGATEPV